MSDVKEVLKKFIEDEFVHDDREINGSLSLLEEEIIDSLGIFTLVSFIEQRFGTVVDAEEVNLDNFDNLDAITKLVEAKLA